MQVFTATLNQMLVLFIFMALGFFLNKKRLLPLDDSVVLSKLETYAFVPCLVFSVFYKYCTVENFKQKWTYMLYGAAVMAVSLPIGIVLAKFFAKDGYLKKYIHIPLRLPISALWATPWYSLKTLASDKKVYLASVIRLIILPSTFMAVLLLLKTDKDIIRVALCATAMPLGLNTVVFPAAYGGDTTPDAGMRLYRT